MWRTKKQYMESNQVKSNQEQMFRWNRERKLQKERMFSKKQDHALKSLEFGRFYCMALKFSVFSLKGNKKSTLHGRSGGDAIR
jgi:hypothetical protein